MRHPTIGSPIITVLCVLEYTVSDLWQAHLQIALHGCSLMGDLQAQVSRSGGISYPVSFNWPRQSYRLTYQTLQSSNCLLQIVCLRLMNGSGCGSFECLVHSQVTLCISIYEPHQHRMDAHDGWLYWVSYEYSPASVTFKWFQWLCSLRGCSQEVLRQQWWLKMVQCIQAQLLQPVWVTSVRA